MLRLLLILVLSLVLQAQPPLNGVGGANYPSTNPSGTSCSGNAILQVYAGTVYSCQSGTYQSIGGGGGGGNAPAVTNTVTFSATPTYALGTAPFVFEKITLTGNTTGGTVTGIAAGQSVIMIICEQSPGGYTFVYPSGFSGGLNPSVAVPSGQCGYQPFISFDGSTLHGVGPGNVN